MLFGGKEGFCFVFNMGDTRAHLCAAKWLPERESKYTEEEEVPVSSKSLKVRVGRIYLTSGVKTFIERTK